MKYMKERMPDNPGAEFRVAESQKQIDEYQYSYLTNLEEWKEEATQSLLKATPSKTFLSPKITTLDSLTFPDTKPSEEEQNERSESETTGHAKE